MMNIPRSLIEKYNVPVPRYTSYPPANYFSDGFGSNAFKSLVQQSNNEAPENISLYIHIPFCPVLCLYCGCNHHITRDEDLKTTYLKAIKQEFGLLRPLLDRKRKVSQIHWGGGTPNSLTIGQITGIMNMISQEFEFTGRPEIAIECNPALLDHEYVDGLLNAGFNRISLGVQDFSEKVLNTVHRAIPRIPVSAFAEQIKSSGKARVNLDFIYGLPHQSVQSFSETIRRAVEISPDRLVTFSYAHIPNIMKAQAALEKEGLAGPEEKISMFEETYRIMTSAGYIPVGLDHFALPGDELSLAAGNKTLHRNFQGYCTRETTGQVYALGTTGISQLESGYAQNAKTVSQYVTLIQNGDFATEKGYILPEKEKIIRHVINEIMCNNYLSWEETAGTLNRDTEYLRSTIRYSVPDLERFASENLLEFSDREIKITETGRFFIRNIAASFDPALGLREKTFSKAL